VSQRLLLPLALLLGGVVLLAAALGGAAPIGDRTSPRSSAVASADATPIAAASVPQRDASVAFWEERLAAGGGLETRLALIDALLERARASGDVADLEWARAAVDEVRADTADPDAAVLLARGRIAFALHEFARARDAAEAALAIEPTDAGTLALLGDVLVELGEVEAADEAYARLADAAPPGNPSVMSRLGRRAWIGGDVQRAESLVRDAIRASVLIGSDDERAFFHFQLGEMLRSRDALPDAEAAYRAAMELQPDHAPSAAGLARVLEARGHRDEAIPLLEAATARLPAPDLVAALGDLYALDGRADDAEDQWALVERIADVASASGSLHDRQLVLFLADHDRDPARAAELARAELDVRGDVYGHDALAWALFKAGDPQGAREQADLALALGTPEGRFHLHAGLIAEALGDLTDARAHLERAGGMRASLPPLQVPVLDKALARVPDR
jgi:tetratricopeptide (TPR) repeat protein